MKSATLILFLATGICSGLSAMYVWGGYLSGLPTKWWSGPLVFFLLAASVGMLIAGAATPVSVRVSRVVALCSGSILETFLAFGVITGVGLLLSPARDYSLTWAPFAGSILLPFLLTTASLVVAWRVR
jgi:hypothetical protein